MAARNSNGLPGIQANWLTIVAPGSVAMAVLFGLPMLFLTVYSLFRDIGTGQVAFDISFGNYSRFLSDLFYIEILLNTLLLSSFVALISVVMAYPVAYVLARTHSRWRGMLIFLVAAPLLVSVVIRNVGWLPILGLNGLLSNALIALGITREPFSLLNSSYGVVIGLVNSLLPLMILTLMTVIQRISPVLEEAAISLGASASYVFRRIILPLSLRGLAAGFVLVFTVSISSYTTPAVLGGGKVIVMSTFIERQSNFVLAFSFSAACSIILMVATCILTFGVLGRLETRG